MMRCLTCGRPVTWSGGRWVHTDLVIGQTLMSVIRDATHPVYPYRSA